MPEDSVSHLQGQRRSIKQRWEALLCAEPTRPVPANSIVRPEMLVFMLNDTLDRLDARLRLAPASDRQRRDLAPYGEVHADCQCGLHLLLSYYLAGARALHETLPATLGPARVEVLHVFNQLAHDDMAALCGICRYRGGTLCSLREDPVTISSGAAASPATPSATGRSRAGTPG